MLLAARSRTRVELWLPLSESASRFTTVPSYNEARKVGASLQLPRVSNASLKSGHFGIGPAECPEQHPANTQDLVKLQIGMVDVVA